MTKIYVFQVQGVLADQKSLDLRTLLENARGMESPSNGDIIRYRREAELNAGSDEHLYRVDWVSYFEFDFTLY